MSEIKELCQCVNQSVDQCLAQGQDPSGNDQPLYDEMNLASAQQGIDRLDIVLS